MLGPQTGGGAYAHTYICTHTHGVFLRYECGTQGHLDLGLRGEYENAGLLVSLPEPSGRAFPRKQPAHCLAGRLEGNSAGHRDGHCRSGHPEQPLMAGAALKPSSSCSGLGWKPLADRTQAPTASHSLMAWDKGLFLFAVYPVSQPARSPSYCSGKDRINHCWRQ